MIDYDELKQRYREWRIGNGFVNNRLLDQVGEAIVAAKAQQEAQDVDKEHYKNLCEAGGLLIAYDDDGTVSGHEITSMSGGAQYTDDGFPKELTLKIIGDDREDYPVKRYTIGEQPDRLKQEAQGFDVHQWMNEGKPLKDNQGGIWVRTVTGEGYKYVCPDFKEMTLNDFIVFDWQPYEPDITEALIDGEWYWCELEDAVKPQPALPVMWIDGQWHISGTKVKPKINKATGKPIRCVEDTEGV